MKVYCLAIRTRHNGCTATYYWHGVEWGWQKRLEGAMEYAVEDARKSLAELQEKYPRIYAVDYYALRAHNGRWKRKFKEFVANGMSHKQAAVAATAATSDDVYTLGESDAT